METTDSFSTLEAQFLILHPSTVQPLYGLERKSYKTEIDRMLKDFKGCRLRRSIYSTPRPGMITEYMSDEWHSLYCYAVDKGKR